MAQTNGTKPEDVAEAAKKGDVKVEVGGKEVDFKDISVEEAFKMLKATPEGLSSAEQAKRLEEYGPNKLPESSQSRILKFLGYMWNPLSWAMEAAAIIALALLDFADFALILTLLVLNATISFVEESNADSAIKALTAALAPKAKALRDGKLETIEATGLVPGDVILVRLGDVVPADCKLLGETGEHDQPLQVDQAALTGESLPVKKFTGGVAFSGSAIKQGEKHALVYATGAKTFFGRAAMLISGTQNVANIQKIMTRIGACCLITIGVWVVIELAVQFGHYRHHCAGGFDRCPTLLNMLVIVVGGIPIAMPTVLSVTLALGAFDLAKEGAIVARMSAVEEMAGMDMLCSDKTGTLTLNKLTVNQDDVFATTGLPLEELLKYGALSANIATEEPIDMVMHNSYPGKDALWEGYTLKKFVPFNPVDKITIAHVVAKAGGKYERVMKGAPQVVLKKSQNAAEIGDAVRGKIQEYASRGFRALGVAVGEGPKADDPYTMVSVVPMYDPPRHDTKATIEKCLEKGISVKMVTGDQLLIGKETARQLGMGQNMYTTEALLKHDKPAHGDDKLPDVPTDQLVEDADGFAEVFPEHKYEIVAILQRRHHVVAMTGDGVNDAPALKKADVGIAVADATDAARGAADIVLTEEGLSTIVSAVIGARRIFQRMTTYAKYTVAMTFRVCFTFGLLTCIYNWYFPTLLIVLLAVFNDGAMIALSKDRVIPSPTPDKWELRNIFIQGIFYGLYLTFSTWLLYFVASKTQFFPGSIRMFSLNDQYATLENWCLDTIRARGFDPNANICTAVPYYATELDCSQTRSVLTQCRWEQYYVRNSMLRSLIYVQVSISGQAVVFVVRDIRHSFTVLAGFYTYVAFALAQLASTIIGVFGFGGYTFPAEDVRPCAFCQLSTGGNIPFFEGRAPIAYTESGSTDSTIGCTYYVVVAWIWALLFYLGLDPLKWAMAYALNEHGFRDRRHGRAPRKAAPVEPRPDSGPSKEQAMVAQHQTGGLVAPTAANPLGRASIQRPTADAFARASIVRVGEDGRLARDSAPRERTSANPNPPSFLQRMSQTGLGPDRRFS